MNEPFGTAQVHIAGDDWSDTEHVGDFDCGDTTNGRWTGVSIDFPGAREEEDAGGPVHYVLARFYEDAEDAQVASITIALTGRHDIDIEVAREPDGQYVLYLPHADRPADEQRDVQLVPREGELGSYTLKLV